MTRIILDGSQVDPSDPDSLSEELYFLLKWATETAQLRLGEYPEILWDLNCLSYYIAQVDNGGHKQFIMNSNNLGNVDDRNRRITTSLSLVEATDFSDIFSEFLNLINIDSELYASLTRSPYDKAPPPIDSLDDRFFALGGSEKVIRFAIAWLKSQPNFAVLSREQIEDEKAQILLANYNLKARNDERLAAQQATEAADLKFVYAKRLCAKLGLSFVAFTMGPLKKAPDTELWGMVTDQGPRCLVLGPKAAQLLDRDITTVLATIPLVGNALGEPPSKPSLLRSAFDWLKKNN